MDMSGVVEATLESLEAELGHENDAMTLEDVQRVDHLARQRAEKIARRQAGEL
jgi:hypothetical protein